MSHGKTNPANCGPHSWWVATLLQRFEPYDENSSDEERPCYAHENVMLVKATDREEAYRKAIELGEAWHRVREYRGWAKGPLGL
jgi:hypothetical protein